VASDEYKKSIYEILEDPASCPVQLTEGTMGKLTSFITMIRSFSVLLRTKPAFDLAKHIAASSGLLKEMYEDKTPEGVSRYENIEELLNAIKEFSEKKIRATERIPEESIPAESEPSPPENEKPLTLDQFMQDIALLTDQDNSDSENQDRVTLMTIHAAKGLEFPFVYVVGMEENLFPSAQSMASRTDLEEERRLFYVAITRAQQKLTLSYAENRYRWGNLTSNDPSRFLQEIPEEHIDAPQRPAGRQTRFLSDDNFSGILAGKAPVAQKPVNLKNFHKLSNLPSGPAPAGNAGTDIQTGMDVEHERFGKGKVISLEGTGPNTKATVFFPGVGQKQLLLRFAKLKIV
jgi:DNA helicase-2/ATP-dependent DNA helicase PcrA